MLQTLETLNSNRPIVRKIEGKETVYDDAGLYTNVSITLKHYTKGLSTGNCARST